MLLSNAKCYHAYGVNGEILTDTTLYTKALQDAPLVLAPETLIYIPFAILLGGGRR